MANQLFRRVFQYNLIGQKLMGLHRVALNLGQKVLTRFHPQFPFIEGQGGYGWNVILQYGTIIKGRYLHLLWYFDMLLTEFTKYLAADGIIHAKDTVGTFCQRIFHRLINECLTLQIHKNQSRIHILLHGSKGLLYSHPAVLVNNG